MSLRTTRIGRFALGALVLLVSAAAGLALSALVSGGGAAPDASRLPGTPAAGASHFSPRAAESAPGPGVSIVARARSESVLVRRSPSGRARARRLEARTLGERRLPLVFLVKHRRGRWVQVYLPVRPNLSSGWIRASELKLSADPYSVEVELRRHRLVVRRGRRRVVSTRIAVGRALSPTPTGRYYLTDLLRPPDPKGFYGPYAFGLSAHSPVYTRFEGGDGQVGIHGTNTPSVIGTDVSHGCIRVTNAVIRRLVRLLPLGTPVTIRR